MYTILDLSKCREITIFANANKSGGDDVDDDNEGDERHFYTIIGPTVPTSYHPSSQSI